MPPGPSDIDIGVKGIPGEKWSIKEKVRLSGALEDLFGCGRVELVFLTETDPFLAAEIIRGQRLFARNEHEADEYELYILRRAGDLAPLERERMALVLGEPT
ncbi:MAG: nucleotidyltransferase domain-containing protein [Deltaproteobacteria bacterium]|nr:nucleotidyltransferase domain-containing protein [Deltaproteobacteria bacterium]